MTHMYFVCSFFFHVSSTENPATEASGPPTSVETYRDAVNFLQKAILSGAEKEGIRRRKLCYFTKGGLFVYAEHIKNNELSLVEIVKYLNGVRKVEKPLSVNSEKICEFDAKLGALATSLENQDEKCTDSEAIKVFYEAILFKLQNTRFLLEVYLAADKCYTEIKSINDSAKNVDKIKYSLGDLAHCSDELAIIFAEWEECVTKMTKNDNLESNCKNYSTQEVAEETQASSDPSRCYKITLFQVDAIKKARQLLSKVFDALNNLSIDLIDYNFTTELTESMKLIMSSLTASARVFERDVAKYVKTKNDHSSEENTRAIMEEFHESLCITVGLFVDVLQEGLIAYNKIISSYKSDDFVKEPAVFDYGSTKGSITETLLKMFETIRSVTGQDIPKFFEESFDEESEKPTIKTPLTFFDNH